jgi:hypothetical protein
MTVKHARRPLQELSQTIPQSSDRLFGLARVKGSLLRFRGYGLGAVSEPVFRDGIQVIENESKVRALQGLEHFIS